MTIKPFIMMEYELLEAKGFVDYTKDKPEERFVNLIANDKIVYAYIRARVKYFVDEKGGEYFDTQEAIADALNMDVKSARKSLSKFIEAGILVCEKKKFRNFLNWRYSKVKDLVLWKKGEKGKPVLMEGRTVKTSLQSKEKHVTSKPQQPVPDWLDDIDEPF